MKQTLEEAALQKYPADMDSVTIDNESITYDYHEEHRNAFIAGAQWRQEQQWINLKDALPESQSHVLIWVGKPWNTVIKVFYTSKGYWVNMEDIVLPKYFEVTHWQPLPKPPQI